MANNFWLGARERKVKDDSIPVELLPSNKTLYVAKLNNDEAAGVEPVECNNLKQVFEKFQPSFSAEVETLDGQSAPAEFKIRAMKDFQSKELIEQNEYLQKVYFSKEILSDLDKQLKKNTALKKTLEDPQTREALLKAAKYYVELLSE
ncbi:MAG TPA: type VI secretion system contractile sheath small subunit [candidate division Zixibacteria bacterium]|nr:type VI secretion system contractile sheath small subunit [candidate division Zixibacteria bacterium]MDD4916515.1 type VI secretion system contractile sheath small subunit [candidate division Zixibacteria bacterium]MDM7972337.1 type VI secretion system contractile sheath small subunit [candidate division Zixibacteria bacterium]HOD65060.1 type VI secretion system contractile sheath small subunit [candidate division Zixibacteria bacterium]HOZ07237.1 type VI secretion system contractile sheath 